MRRKKREYVLRTQQPDGSWVFYLEPRYSKREAEKAAQFGRIIGGMLSQVWPAEEAEAVVAKQEAATEPRT